MRTRALIAFLALVVIGGAVFLLTREQAKVPVAAPEEQPVVAPASAPEAADQGVGWTFVPAGEDAATGGPLTKVTIRYADREREVGTYLGTCSMVREDFLPGERSAVLCWYAGGGTELGVFEEDGGMVVKAGVVDEGTPEEGGFRGDFRTLFRL